ncbi:divergent polysaccharide deacetylase family protein [Sulfitobacter sp. M368]|uniref:divergent polysaccharide deacetylase family protein n=1 Tax=Sulfitobacter sp. M368 TaxID=2867021 RepID=UPI0021A87776|nr:polysaccharide deacteylase family 2 protein [Sulfitobacter sp. M368]UWR16884.1 divergent polysaccharide deacetylase family protein [Sulfitobacter sp. M368]
MARGFLSGVLWGGVLSVGVAGVASVMMPLPQSPVVDDMAPGAVDAPVADPAAPDTQPSTDSAPASVGTAPQATAPAPDSEAALGAEEQSSAGRPETGSADGLQAPAGTDDTGSVAIAPDAPVLPNPQALAPMAPPETDDVAINTDPGLPQQPVTQSDDPALSRAPEAEEPVQAPVQIGEAPADSVKPDLAGNTEADQAPETPQTASQPEAPAPALEPAQPQTAENETNDENTGRPSIGKPAISLTDRDSGVTINRGPATDALVDAGTTPAAPEVVAEVGPALEINAEPFENPEGKPLMAIVLIDDGNAPVTGAAGIAALRSFPYPLSFAVNANAPDAAERIALYRSEGLEVLIEVDLPEAATAVDAETLLATALAGLPGAVAVLEGTDTGVQGSKELSDQVTAILGQTGHGLVTQDKGLNTMPKLARKAGVAADPIFRDFDSKGQTATVIRRFLDQAAFRAGQDGGVIMLGRLRADTISALLLWGLQDRAGKVALAPISAVLSREQ